MFIRITVLVAFIFFYSFLYGQDSSISMQRVSSEYPDKISSKANQLEQKLDRKSEKVLQSMQKQEARLKHRLTKIDSLAANNIFSDEKEKYSQLEQKLESPGKLTQYIPHLDSISTSLNFLTQNDQFISQAKDVHKN